MPSITVKRTLSDAIIPTKAHSTDVGYDLTIVSLDQLVLVGNRLSTNEVALYDTGISVQPENGYYVEVVPRSSLVKTGYIMTNGVGIIDPDYRGSIKVALTKIDPHAPTIQLPLKGFQMILRKLETSNLVETATELSSTSRGDGGFGSTDDSSVSESVSAQQVVLPTLVQTNSSRRKGGNRGVSALGEALE
jgi:dUTP pyrophosphatase